MRTLVSNTSTTTTNGSGQQARHLPLTFSHTILFHLHLSAATDGGRAPVIKYRNFEGAELRADLSAGETIQVSHSEVNN